MTDPSYEYLVVLSQFVKRLHSVKGSFGLYFGVFKSQNCYDCRSLGQPLLFFVSANMRWDAFVLR